MLNNNSTMTKENKLNVLKGFHNQFLGKVVMVACISGLFALGSCDKDSNELIEPDPVTESVNDTIMPTYPGGTPALIEFLEGNLKYPEQAEREGIEGRVVATFVVELDGSVSNVEIALSVHPLLDAEALRVVSLMPNWNPGKNCGRVCYSMPVTFRLRAENESAKVKIQ